MEVKDTLTTAEWGTLFHTHEASTLAARLSALLHSIYGGASSPPPMCASHCYPGAAPTGQYSTNTGTETDELAGALAAEKCERETLMARKAALYARAIADFTAAFPDLIHAPLTIGIRRSLPRFIVVY
jgi:hypothetical protein